MSKSTFQMPAASDVIIYIVSHRPGITEAELATAMFGKPDQPRVHQDCDLLESKGLIRRDRDSRPLRLYSA
jgi:hypothetical protein